MQRCTEVCAVTPLLGCLQIVSPRGTVSEQTENGPLQYHQDCEQPSSSSTWQQSDTAVQNTVLTESSVNTEICDQTKTNSETASRSRGEENNSALVAWSPFVGLQSIGNMFLGIHKALRRSLRQSLFRFTPELHLQ